MKVLLLLALLALAVLYWRREERMEALTVRWNSADYPEILPQ